MQHLGSMSKMKTGYSDVSEWSNMSNLWTVLVSEDYLYKSN